MYLYLYLKKNDFYCIGDVSLKNCEQDLLYKTVNNVPLIFQTNQDPIGARDCFLIGWNAVVRAFEDTSNTGELGSTCIFYK